jgi:hypothetical protein
LAALCARLRTETFVTVDTEFMRERTYWPELCLVQLAGEHEVAEVDALAPGLDLAPLGELLADPAVVKVFHAARQDVEIFLLKFGAVPTPLFDTQIAAMVAGFGDQVSYDGLCRSLAGVQIDKAHRFSDWSARPLSAAQLAYAAADVTHLRKIYTALDAKLRREGRLAWVAEEMGALADPATYLTDPESAWERLRPAHHQPPLPGRAAGRDRLARTRGAAHQHPAPAPGEGRDAARDRRHHARDTGRPGTRARHLGRLRQGAVGRRASRRGEGRERPGRWALPPPDLPHQGATAPWTAGFESGELGRGIVGAPARRARHAPPQFPRSSRGFQGP